MIFHIVKRSEWLAAARDGGYRPASVEAEGFMHCSTRTQLIGTANRFYAGQKDLVVLCIDENRIATPLKFEPPSTPHLADISDEDEDHKLERETRGSENAGDLFPHIYGALNLDAVTRVIAFPCRDDGSFAIPAELPQS